MLSSNTLTRQLLHRLLRNITQSNHTHSLPDSQTNSRRNTTVQTLDSTLLVNVSESISHSHFLWAIRVVGFGLHFYAHDFDGLVPGGETSSKGRGEDAFGSGEFLGGIGFAGEAADAVLAEILRSVMYALRRYNG